MALLLAAAAFAAGSGAGWLAARWQHLLYRQAEFRHDPLRGGRQRVFGVALGLAWGLSAAIAFRPGHYDFGPALLTAVFAGVLIVLASTDVERRIIPDRLVFPALLAALACAWAWPDRTAWQVGEGLFAALAAGAVLYGTGLAMNQGFGMGDFKLVMLVGALAGWPALLAALLIGLAAGAVPSLALLLRGRRRATISYGPYLVLGALAVLLDPGRFT
jgi:prepilin signal peptidase PulO-like enzyme (type II secretory pathway)